MFTRTFRLFGAPVTQKPSLDVMIIMQVRRRHPCLCEAAVVPVLLLPSLNTNDAVRGNDPRTGVLSPRQRA
jgi:hypothetical protein